MTDTLTIVGVVATVPSQFVTGKGLVITSFRLASSQRRFDREAQKWVDGDTNWYTISSFRSLAQNVSASVLKGQRVIVHGRLRIREWRNGDKTGTNVDIEAEALGHDLTWGVASWTRSVVGAPGERTTAQESASQSDPAVGDWNAAAIPSDAVDDADSPSHLPVVDTVSTPF